MQDADWMVVHLQGEVDLASAPQLRRELYDLIDQGHRSVAIDLTSVDFMDSTRSGVLSGALKRLRETDGTLCSPASSPPSAACSYHRPRSIFTIHESLAEIGVPRVVGARTGRLTSEDQFRPRVHSEPDFISTPVSSQAPPLGTTAATRRVHDVKIASPKSARMP